MSARILLVVSLFGWLLACPVWAQQPGEPSGGAALDWRPVDEAARGPVRPEITHAADTRLSAAPSGAGEAAAPEAQAPRSTPPAAEAGRGNGTLPNEHGQVWREYDIAPYTVRVTSTQKPEQALVDWILRETGYEAWHGEPLGILSATSRTLRVYHTPEMQEVVADLVDRFVGSQAETWQFSLRIITLDQPGWRMRVQRLLRPVTVQTPGVGAWLLRREDAAVLLTELQRRSDYREHTSPRLHVNNGQPTVISAMRTRPYIRDVLLRPDLWQGFEPQAGAVDEGFSLEFSPLLTSDRQLIDAVIKCNIDQVEKMIPVELEAPTSAAPRQRTPIEVPQTAQFRFHERFRWPVGQALLVGMGMVPLPVPVDAKAMQLVPGIPLPLPKTPPRAELLVLIEAKGPAAGGRAASLAPNGGVRR
ncbi:MAG: hypothetical protein ACOCWL_02530 [Thermoguttaceae bacterium]